MSSVLLTGAIKEINNRNSFGQFIRKHEQWSLENFNDGYIDRCGRFRVWFPSHPRAYKEGYILRAIVAYELYHNIVVPIDSDIHHKDKNRLNDLKENLEMLSHKTHAILSNEKKKIEGSISRICEYCGKEFKINKYRLNQQDSNRGRFCSQRCYQIYRRK